MKAFIKQRQTRIGECLLTLSITDIPKLDKALDGIKQGELIEIDIHKPKKKRSLNANAYYHKLCREICDKQGIEMTRYHNRNLAEVGVIARDSKGFPKWDMRIEGFDWEAELETHLKPMPGHTQTINNKRWDLYVEVVGSSKFDTKQMSTLIDMVIADAKELGIETLTPNELERIKSAWKGE